MYIKRSLVLSLFLCLIVSSAYASNIGRNVYGVLAESVSGAHFDAAASDQDSIHLYPWEGTLGSETIYTNAPEGRTYTRLTWSSTGASSGWTGCGWTSTNSNKYHNMAAYYGGKIKFLVRSSNTKVANCRVGIKINEIEIYKTLSSLGFSANGQWQEITIDLNTSTDTRLTSTNLQKVSILFIASQNTEVVSGNILDIDYYSMLENNEVEKSREYKGNSLNMELFENIIKNIPLVKKNDLKMIYIGKDYDKYRTEIKNYCLSLKEKAKTVITNNKEFFSELVL